MAFGEKKNTKNDRKKKQNIFGDDYIVTRFNFTRCISSCITEAIRSVNFTALKLTLNLRRRNEKECYNPLLEGLCDRSL